MTPLPETKSKNGCYYRLVHRTEKAALYSLRYSPEGPIVGYEVFIVRFVGESRLPNGAPMAAHEKFPSNEDFGKTAWAYTTVKTAMEKFSALKAAA